MGFESVIGKPISPGFLQKKEEIHVIKFKP